jgi:hypothetical protein
VNTTETLWAAMPPVTQAEHHKYVTEAKRRQARARRAARRRDARRMARSRETRPIISGFESLHRQVGA